MSLISRLYDFVSNTRAKSAEVDAELNQLVAGHNAQETAIGLKANTSDVLLIATDQVVTSRKSFNVLPYLQLNPVADSEAACKAYVDSTLAGAVLGSVPDGSITDTKLSSLAGQAKARITALEAYIPVIGNITVYETGWVANTGDYALKKTITVAGVTATSWVEITIPPDSIDVATNAELCPTGTCAAGSITLYANVAPANWFIVDYRRVG